MNMSPKEEFKKEVWEILKKIKLNILRAPENSLLIKYETDSHITHDTALLRKL